MREGVRETTADSHSRRTDYCMGQSQLGYASFGGGTPRNDIKGESRRGRGGHGGGGEESALNFSFQKGKHKMREWNGMEGENHTIHNY